MMLRCQQSYTFAASSYPLFYRCLMLNFYFQNFPAPGPHGNYQVLVCFLIGDVMAKLPPEDILFYWMCSLDSLWCSNSVFTSKHECLYVFHFCCHRHRKCPNNGMCSFLLSDFIKKNGSTRLLAIIKLIKILLVHCCGGCVTWDWIDDLQFSIIIMEILLA